MDSHKEKEVSERLDTESISNLSETPRRVQEALELSDYIQEVKKSDGYLENIQFNEQTENQEQPTLSKETSQTAQTEKVEIEENVNTQPPTIEDTVQPSPEQTSDTGSEHMDAREVSLPKKETSVAFLRVKKWGAL